MFELEVYVEYFTEFLEKVVYNGYLEWKKVPRFIIVLHLISKIDAERGTSMYKVFLNALVATQWNVFAGDIVVKSRNAIKLHQEKYSVNSVIPHNVLASDYLTDCHQALFFQQDTLVY